jgi:hypothetical protein
VKVVSNTHGGNAVTANWTLTADGGAAGTLSGAGGAVSGAGFKAGTYALSESAGPAGYAASSWSCVGTGSQNGSNITLAVGQSATCTITNSDLPGTLIVKKVVINDNGGSKIATDFGFQVNGGAVTSFIQSTDTLHGENALTVNAGTFTVTEPAVAGYATTYNNCSNVAISVGGTATCTITNNDVQQGGVIAPTEATCQDFAAGSIALLNTVFYNVGNNGKIAQNVNPGVFFYYSRVTLAAGQVLSVTQSVAPPGSAPLFSTTNQQVTLYTNACGTTAFAPASINNTTGVVTWGNNVPAGTYIVRLKYDSKSIVGAPAPATDPLLYSFSTKVNGVEVTHNTNGLYLKKQ